MTLEMQVKKLLGINAVQNIMAKFQYYYTVSDFDSIKALFYKDPSTTAEVPGGKYIGYEEIAARAFGGFPGGIEAQAAQVLKNCEAIMKEAFLGLHVIVKTTVYLKDLADFAAFDRVYRTFFPDIKPALTVVAVPELLVKDALLMVDMVACK